MSKQAIIISGSNGNLAQAFITSIGSNHYDLFFVKDGSKLYSANIGPVDDEMLLNYTTVKLIHLASPDHESCQRDASLALDVNYYLVLNLLDKAYSQKITTIIFASTTRVYGDNITRPIDEDSKLCIENSYSAVKYLTERMLECMWREQNLKLNIFILRISNVVSVLGNDNLRRPLLNEFCWQAAKYNEIIIRNPENLVKNFVNIHNVCHSIKELLKYEKTPK